MAKRVRRILSDEMLQERAETNQVPEADRRMLAERRKQQDRFNAERDARIRKNRKKEWTVVWQGGAPQ